MSKKQEKPKQEETKDEKKALPDPEEPKTAEATEPENGERIAELENRYLRLMAEYDNFRKRTQAEKSRLYKDACADVVAQLLPLIDSLDRSVELAKTVTGEGRAFADGIPLMADQALKILEGLKVDKIDALNQPFDPELHHALQQMEQENTEPNTVIEVVQTGYRLGERLIRPALVIVSA